MKSSATFNDKYTLPSFNHPHVTSCNHEVTSSGLLKIFKLSPQLPKLINGIRQIINSTFFPHPVDLYREHRLV